MIDKIINPRCEWRVAIGLRIVPPRVQVWRTAPHVRGHCCSAGAARATIAARSSNIGASRRRA
ncbi:MAG: hypothetical protein JNK56_09320 [Myxococcales bacterium]|nr:hypothetical protein [Myxococcales bacterium]